MDEGNVVDAALRLRQIHFYVETESQPSLTRFGYVYHGLYDGMRASVCVLPKPRVTSSSLGYYVDDIKLYNLKKAAAMCSGRAGMLQLRRIKKLNTGEAVAIYEGFMCTLKQAVESGLLETGLLRSGDQLNPMGAKLMFQHDQVLRTLMEKRLLHPEVDMTSLVVLAADESELDIRLMPSPLMQRLSSSSSQGLNVAELAAPIGFASPPELRGGMAVGLSTTTYLVYAALATVYKGQLGVVSGAASLQKLKPHYLADKLCCALDPDPTKRPSMEELAGHYCSIAQNYLEQYQLVHDLGNILQDHVKDDKPHPIGTTLDDAGVKSLLGTEKLTNLPGGDAVSNALEFHEPEWANAGSKRSFGWEDKSKPDAWKVPKVCVGVRNVGEHPLDKVTCPDLRAALGLKLDKSDGRAGDELKSALMKVTFPTLAWRLWKILRDKHPNDICNGSLSRFFRQHSKQQVDSRSHKPDGQHSNAEASIALQIKARLDNLPSVPWVAKMRLRAVDAAGDAFVGYDDGEGPGSPGSPEAVVPLLPDVIANENSAASTGEAAAGAQPDGRIRFERGSSSGGEGDVYAAAGAQADGDLEPAPDPQAAAPRAAAVQMVASAAAVIASQDVSTGTAAQGVVEATAAVPLGVKRPVEQVQEQGRHKLNTTEKKELEMLSGYAKDMEDWRALDTEQGCGEGSNHLVWRRTLPGSLAPSDLQRLVRPRSSLVMGLRWHHQDKDASLHAHELHLRSVHDDVIVTPLAGPAVLRSVAQHAACHLAAHGTPPAGSGRNGILATERMYPDGYDDDEAGADIDLFRLWYLRDKGAQQARARLIVQDHPRVRLMQGLLTDYNAKQLERQLSVMADCTCPITWHMFTQLLSQQPDRRTPALQQLQLSVLRQELAAVISPNNTTIKETYLHDLAPRLLLMGPPEAARVMHLACAAERVQEKLWEDVLEVMPKVPLSEAIGGPNKNGTKAGLYYLLQTLLELPLKEVLRSQPVGPEAAGLGDFEKRHYSIVHCSYLSTELLRSDALSNWRQQQLPQ